MSWTWKDEIEQALTELGGEAGIPEITKRVEQRGQKPVKDSSIRYTLEAYCPDKHFREGVAIFYHKGGNRSGVYGLIRRPGSSSSKQAGGSGTNKSYLSTVDVVTASPSIVPITENLETQQAEDFNQPTGSNRILCQTYRILRDTDLARRIKLWHDYKCQLCGSTTKLHSGNKYAEAHHLNPLGAPHNGPDEAENIICVCPNHHVELDYGVIKLDKSMLNTHPNHVISTEYIDYHNTEIFGKH